MEQSALTTERSELRDDTSISCRGSLARSRWPEPLRSPTHMSPYVILLCLVVAVFVLVLPIQIRVRGKMQRYWQRACTGVQWRRRFPDAPKAEIRDFLGVFVEAFAYRKTRRFCFSPDDKVMEIYHNQYPEKGMADAMELEFLARDMRKQYGVDLTAFWKEDITLGELFIHSQSA